MSDLKATVAETSQGFHVEGYEKITYDFKFVDGVFDIQNPGLADCYKPWGRVLAVTDKNVYGLYGEKMESYFQHFGLTLKVHETSIGEKAKTVDTWMSICDSMTDFGIIRKVRQEWSIFSTISTPEAYSSLGTCACRWWRVDHRCCWVSHPLPYPKSRLEISCLHARLPRLSSMMDRGLL